MAAAGAIVPLIASLVGTGLSYKASSDAADGQKRSIRRAGETAKEITADSVNLATKGAQKYAPEERAATLSEAERVGEESLGQALTATQDRPTQETGGRVSDDFLQGKAKAAIDRTTRGKNLAHMMARLKAPQDLRFSEGISNADTVSKIGANTGDARNAFRDGQTAASGISPDGSLNLAGDVLRAGAGAYSSRQDRLRRSGIYGQP